jgi:hypothetical protein
MLLKVALNTIILTIILDNEIYNWKLTLFK